MKFYEIDRVLKDHGWYVHSINGSQYQYKHLVQKGKVTVPFHRGDLDIGTVHSIFKQAKVDWRS